MERLEELKALLVSAEEDAVKFYEKGNSTAGTRLRKSMQEMKVLAQEIRNNVQDIKNG